ncbi:MAG: hypothetical protein IJA69_04135 [Clostridia bacterium]|nr:hypothetical protein [Clostridia bacterium]
MKTIIIFISIFFCFCGTIPSSPTFADNLTYYGRAVSGNVNFYHTPIASAEKILFKIPKTYFVKIIADENETFYKAQYMDEIYGYIKKSEMSYIDTRPANPYADQIGFRIFTPGGANLRSSPNNTLGAINLITTIPYLETNLLFVGNCDGEEAIKYKGTNWYYCKYYNNSQTPQFGYVYSAFCDLMPSIADNTEQFEYTTVEFKQTTQNETISQDSELLTLSSPAQIAIIVAVSLPCVLIIYFLFKPTKISMQTASPSQQKSVKSKPKKRKAKKKIKHLKGSDYYELDGDFFN